MSSDLITRDLCRKAADDADAAVKRTCALLPDPVDQAGVALFAAASVLGIASGYFCTLAKINGKHASTDEIVDGLWTRLRPMVMRAAGDM